LRNDSTLSKSARCRRCSDALSVSFRVLANLLVDDQTERPSSDDYQEATDAVMPAFEQFAIVHGVESIDVAMTLLRRCGYTVTHSSDDEVSA
jgi:hypothetical protein